MMPAYASCFAPLWKVRPWKQGTGLSVPCYILKAQPGSRCMNELTSEDTLPFSVPSHLIVLLHSSLLLSPVLSFSHTPQPEIQPQLTAVSFLMCHAVHLLAFTHACVSVRNSCPILHVSLLHVPTPSAWSSLSPEMSFLCQSLVWLSLSGHLGLLNQPDWPAPHHLLTSLTCP